MQYSDAQIRQYIREVVREAKDTANIETGYLKRSIRGALIGRNRSVEFRQVFYGAFNENSKLLEIANRLMPKDIDWKIIFEDEEGEETIIKAKTRTGRKVSTKSISNQNQSTTKIKALISAIKSNGEKKDDTGEGSGKDNDEPFKRDR